MADTLFVATFTFTYRPTIIQALLTIPTILTCRELYATHLLV
jgi:hypothetical protein